MSRNRLKSHRIQCEYGNEVMCEWRSKPARAHDHTEMDFAFRVELLHAICRTLPPFLICAAIGVAKELSK